MHEIKTGTLNIQTEKHTQIVDITDTINSILKQECHLCNILVMHTTAAVAIVDIDPGAEKDYIKAFDQIAPQLEYKYAYNPDAMPQHVLAALLGPSLSLPVIDGKLFLGQWQKVVLVELNGPRNRKIAITGMS